MSKPEEERRKERSWGRRSGRRAVEHLRGTDEALTLKTCTFQACTLSRFWFDFPALMLIAGFWTLALEYEF